MIKVYTNVSGVTVLWKTFSAPEVSVSKLEYFLLPCESLGVPGALHELSCSLSELRKTTFLSPDVLEAICRQHMMFCASLTVSGSRYMNSKLVPEIIEKPQQCWGSPEGYNYKSGSV